MTAGATPDPTIRRAVTIDRPRADVFELFTRRTATWWPLANGTYQGANAVDIVIEPRSGGLVYETARDGSRVAWGRVLDWEPPAHFAYSYRPFGDERFTEVQVWFDALTPARTEVRVHHLGWEAHGALGMQRATSYLAGWEHKLELLARAAQSAQGAEGQTRAQDGTDAP
jgi:uncharacterized protein YndB with AHSA1/START domain